MPIKTRTLGALPLILLLASCAEPAVAPQAAAWTGGTIKDEATFRQEIVGRTMRLSNQNASATVVVAPDGTMDVTVTTPDGERVINRLEGTWTFDNGQFCRTLTTVEGSSSAPPTGCQSLTKIGNQVTFTDGRGPQVWTVAGA